MILHEAIYKLNSTIVTIRGEIAYDADEQVVEYDLAAAEALVEANKYKEQRAVAYPSIQDQLDTLYHGGYEAWKATIEEVKQEFPKP
jgi:ABC-type transport system substrate-binding protein